MGLRYRNMNLQKVTANIPDALSVDIANVQSYLPCHLCRVTFRVAVRLRLRERIYIYRQQSVMWSDCHAKRRVMWSDSACEAACHVKRCVHVKIHVMWLRTVLVQRQSCEGACGRIAYRWLQTVLVLANTPVRIRRSVGFHANLHVQMCIHTHVLMCICINICIYIDASICTQVCIYGMDVINGICMYVCMNVCMYACMHACVYVCM